MARHGFGEYVKDLRIARRIGLREFCVAAECDPSNWSKIERGVLAPPTDDGALDRVAKVLKIGKGTDEWHKLHDLAFVDRGQIPNDIMSDEELVSELPAFFRTVRGEKPTAEELRRFAETLKKS